MGEKDFKEFIIDEIMPKLDSAYEISLDNLSKLQSLSVRDTSYQPESISTRDFYRLLDINLKLIDIIKSFYDPTVVPDSLSQLDIELKELKNEL